MDAPASSAPIWCGPMKQPHWRGRSPAPAGPGRRHPQPPDGDLRSSGALPPFGRKGVDFPAPLSQNGRTGTGNLWPDFGFNTKRAGSRLIRRLLRSLGGSGQEEPRSAAVMASCRYHFDGNHGVMNGIDQPVLPIDPPRPKPRQIASQSFRLPCSCARVLPQFPQQGVDLAQQRKITACLMRQDVSFGSLGEEDGIHHRLPNMSFKSLSSSRGTVLPFRACSADMRMASTLLRFKKYGSPLGLGLHPSGSTGQTRTESKTVLPSAMRGRVSGTKTPPWNVAFRTLMVSPLSSHTTLDDSLAEVKPRSDNNGCDSPYTGPRLRRSAVPATFTVFSWRL